MKIVYTCFIVAVLFIFNGCQTIENKSQSAIKKENEKLSKFLQQPESELKIVMGEPDEVAMIIKVLNFLYIRRKNTILLAKESSKLIKI